MTCTVGILVTGARASGTWDCLKRLAVRGHTVRVIGLAEER